MYDGLLGMARLAYLAVVVAVALGVSSRDTDALDALDLDSGVPDAPPPNPNTACPVTVQSALVAAYSPAVFACLPSLTSLAPAASGDSSPPRLADEGLRTDADAEASAMTQRTVLEAINGSTCDTSCIAALKEPQRFSAADIACIASIRTGGVTSFIPDFLSNFIQFSVQTVAKCGIDPAAIPVSPNGTFSVVELSSPLVIDIETAKATIRDTLVARERAVAALQALAGRMAKPNATKNVNGERIRAATALLIEGTPLFGDQKYRKVLGPLSGVPYRGGRKLAARKAKTARAAKKAPPAKPAKAPAAKAKKAPPAKPAKTPAAKAKKASPAKPAKTPAAKAKKASPTKPAKTPAAKAKKAPKAAAPKLRGKKPGKPQGFRQEAPLAGATPDAPAAKATAGKAAGVGAPAAESPRHHRSFGGVAAPATTASPSHKRTPLGGRLALGNRPAASKVLSFVPKPSLSFASSSSHQRAPAPAARKFSLVPPLQSAHAASGKKAAGKGAGK